MHRDGVGVMWCTVDESSEAARSGPDTRLRSDGASASVAKQGTRTEPALSPNRGHVYERAAFSTLRAVISLATLRAPIADSSMAVARLSIELALYNPRPCSSSTTGWVCLAGNVSGSKLPNV